MTTTATSTILAAIKARLTANFPELAVELYPPRPQEYRLNHPTGAILIACPAANYNDEQLYGSGGAQQRTLLISLLVVTRHLWGDLGAIDLLDQLRASLAGWLPTNDAVLPCVPVRERLLTEDAGIWTHSAEFNITYRETFVVSA